MTFEEAKKKLQDFKAAKNRVRRIQEQIAELVSVKGSLNVTEGHAKGKFHSVVEEAYSKIEIERIRLAEELNKAFALEDEIVTAVEQLSPIEQEIIISSYFQGKSIWYLAEEMCYSERQLKRLKNKAIEEFSKKI